MKKSGLAFHCHHDTLCEYVHDYDERVKFIKKTKPIAEEELRLRLFKLIPEDRIPGRSSPEYDAYDKAREACDKAWETYDKAWEAYDKAREVWVKAWEARDKAWEAWVKAREAWVKAREAYDTKYKDELDALHKELCPDCPFEKSTIFTRKDKDEQWY